MTVSRRLRFEILRRDGHACRYCGAMAPDVKLTVDHVIPVALGGSDEPSNLVTACADCNAGKTSTQPDSTLVDDVASDALRWARALERAAHNLLTDRELMGDLAERFKAQWERWTYEVTVTVPAEPVPPTGDVLVDNWRSAAGWWAGHISRPVSFQDGVLTIQVERGRITEAKAELRRAANRDRLQELLGQEVQKVVVAEGWPGPLPEPPKATTRTERQTVPLPGGWQDSVQRFVSLGLPEDEMHRLVGVTMEKTVPPADRFRFFCGCCWRAITDLHEDARRILESEARPDAP